MGGPKRPQQPDAVLDGTVDQLEHLRDEFLHPRCAKVSVEQKISAPSSVWRRAWSLLVFGTVPGEFMTTPASLNAVATASVN